LLDGLKNKAKDALAKKVSAEADKMGKKMKDEAVNKLKTAKTIMLQPICISLFLL